jgi:hypothetical protein
MTTLPPIQPEQLAVGLISLRVSAIFPARYHSTIAHNYRFPPPAVC